MERWPKTVVVASLLWAFTGVVASAQTAAWTSGFHEAGIDGEVHAALTFDSGSGPAVVVAGNFDSVGGVVAQGIAMWNGLAWLPLGAGFSGDVHSLALFDDGTGSAMYAAGDDSILGERIAKWDGANWLSVGQGLGGGSGCFSVFDLVVFDDGSGPALYAGGDFAFAGGVPARNIARWNGTAWSEVGGGVAGDCVAVFSDGAPAIRALEVFGDGVAPPQLFAGGSLLSAGGVPANAVARWDGSSWKPAGAGFSIGLEEGVRDLQSFDDGSGPKLYAAGNWTNSLMSWDGSSWSGLGAFGPFGVDLRALHVFDEGPSSVLVTGGLFGTVDGLSVNGIAAWDGTNWSGFDQGLFHAGFWISAFATFHADAGPELFAGGRFPNIGTDPVSSRSIARWRSSEWSPVQKGNGAPAFLWQLAALDVGSGPAIYAARDSLNADTEAGIGITVERWDGSCWTTLGEPFFSSFITRIYGFGLFDDGTGTALYVCGEFNRVGTTPIRGVARWDGTNWLPLGAGVGETPLALFSYDDGSGPALYLGGRFPDAAGVPGTASIARWDGTQWSSVGGGFGFGSGQRVEDFAVFDDGTGPALYIGGVIIQASGQSVRNLVRWDGTTFSDVAGGVLGANNVVEDLALFDDGSGTALYVGGEFETAGGLPIDDLARWDGLAWTGLGAGLGSGNDTKVEALAVFDDGGGKDLYAAGEFSTPVAGGTTLLNIARWDGLAWTALGAGINDDVYGLGVIDDGVDGSAALYAGGLFQKAGDTLSRNIARFGTLPWPASAVTRNGSGFNPLGYTSLSDPVLGLAWKTAVDVSAPGVLQSLVAISSIGPTSGIFLGGFGVGEVLVLPPFFFDVAAGSHDILIPLDCSLLGVTVSTQGGTLSSTAADLYNAIDVTLGEL